MLLTDFAVNVKFLLVSFNTIVYWSISLSLMHRRASSMLALAPRGRVKRLTVRKETACLCVSEFQGAVSAFSTSFTQ